jgi:low affinity Fe/Cu permease
LFAAQKAGRGSAEPLAGAIVSNRKKDQPSKHRHSFFTAFANHTARAAGHPVTFVAAVLIIVGWAVSGPIFGFSDTWQLIINTSTTIVTFLMVFLIQNTQNRDSTAMHLKLDEIIFALDGAHNTLMNLEDLEDKDLQAIQKRYKAIAEKAQGALEEEDLEAAAEHIDKLAEAHKPQAKNGGSARAKKRAERNRKRA